MFYNYVDKQEDYQKMIDQLLETKSELGRYPLKLKHQDGTMISVEVDSITSYLGDGQLLHTTLFFFEPPCITPSPSKLGYFSMSHLSLEIPFPPPPPCSPIDQSEIELSLPLNIRLDHSDSADSETKRRKSTPRVKVPSIESQFLAQMSHDIRTPVSGIIGMTSLLQMTSLTSEQKDFVDTIESSSSLLLALLNDILDLSKIEAGKVELECIPFSLPKVNDQLLLSLISLLV